MGSESTRTEPGFMHPAIFIGTYSLVGALFALQEWIFMRRWAFQWNYHFQATITFAEYIVSYFLWGAICWIVWCFFRAVNSKCQCRSHPHTLCPTQYRCLRASGDDVGFHVPVAAA